VIAIDLFAGAGGWTTGAEQAGVRVAAAVNHWPLAVRTHAANHPRTRHLCQDVGLLDARDLPTHDLCVASPSCQGYADARGTDRPHHDAARATPWHVVDVLEVCRPKYLLVENVLELRDRWRLFPAWRAALRALGYVTELHEVEAADHGAPQERVRLVVAGRLGRAPRLRLPPPRAARVPARGIIDFAAGAWSPVAGHVPATLARVARGRAAFGPRFVMPYYKSGSGLTGRSLARPLGTVTTRDRWAVVDGDRMRMLTVAEYRAAMGFPAGYVLHGTRAEQIHQLGNAIVPCVARAVVAAVLA
jgi:DNA (cytosine-5)-methyltransferase 1